MADGTTGGDWYSFGEFSSPEINSNEINEFESNKPHQSVDNQGQGYVADETQTNNDWNVNFDNVFSETNSSSNDSNVSWNSANNKQSYSGDGLASLDLHGVEENKKIATLVDDLFQLSPYGEDSFKKKDNIQISGVDGIYAKSNLSTQLIFFGLDPVKPEDTYFHKLKMKTIVSQLCINQVVENWMSMLHKVNARLYEDEFDYHSSVGKDPKKGTPRKVLQNGNHIKETVLTDNSIIIDKKVESTLKKVNTHTKSALPQLEKDVRKTSEELEEKSTEEVRNIIYELQLQANIYSELLLNELDYRDKLKRDIEGQNNFISSYVAVERKINDTSQNKKKKSRYGFFKQNEGDQKAPVSIPYIQREGGPKPADLALMTEILKAIERDDQGVSKLISDYVFNLGDQHNLQTVIQVRTRNGVTSLSAPEHKKKNFEDANNV